MHTAIYLRVSTSEQNEAGQRREVNKWLKAQGITDGRYYVDKLSGDTLDRPAFQQLQADIAAGQVRMVVCWKLDRLSRSLRDGINVLTDWCDRGLRVVATSQQIDFHGAVGRLVAGVLLAVAEMEQETRRERQASGIAAVLADPKARREKYRGRQPGSTSADPERARSLAGRVRPMPKLRPR